MTFEIFSIRCGGEGLRALTPSVDQWLYSEYDNRDNRLSPCELYRKALDATTADIIVCAHDDIQIHDKEWMARLEKLFANPLCVAAGFGGAWGLGNADLYRKPYKIENLARRGYASNQRDAETHGERFTGDKRVAVLDAFLLAVKVDWLRRRRTLSSAPKHAFDLGWPVSHLTHHCLDLWLACEAERDGKEIWMAGVDVSHYGGRTSVSERYAKASWLQGGSRESDHRLPHEWLAREYADILPIEVKE